MLVRCSKFHCFEVGRLREIDEHGDFRIVMPPDTCSYLPDEVSSLEYRVSDTMTAERFETLLARGWRRFANYYFRPACPACVKCRSLRIDVNAFTPTRSQRKAVRKNAGVELRIGRPTATAAHIDLFNRYHADMHERRNWPKREITVGEYIEGFLGEAPFGREYVYYFEGELIAVGLVDETPNASSSAYFYHCPTWRDRGIGTYSMVREVEVAKAAGRSWHYLGYWIEQCGSMAYKSRYGPHELLAEYVSDHEIPVWARPNEE